MRISSFIPRFACVIMARMDEIATLLVVEDDPTIRTILEMMLRAAGFTHVHAAARGDEGLTAARRLKPDLVLLDIMLPGLDGLAVCRRIRESPDLADTRIIMITARTEPADVVRGLETGADDYVTKPFDREILLARVRAVLRRRDPAGVPHDGLRLDSEGRTARLDGEDLRLTPSEFRMLALLVTHPGRVLTRGRIIDAMQDEERAVTERTVDVLMVGLRRKLGAWAPHIETIRGVGYRACLD